MILPRMAGVGEAFMTESTSHEQHTPQGVEFTRAELSERELEIIELVAQGHTNLEIAQQAIFLPKLERKIVLR
jgi:DNA-binding NarL/FixJ family response regulator